MTLDEVISDIEANLVERAVDGAKIALAALAPAVVAWFLSPLGHLVYDYVFAPAVRWVARIVVKFFDNRGYYLYKSAVNNSDASAYQDAIRGERVAVESGNKDAILKARAEKRAAFLKLFPLTA